MQTATLGTIDEKGAYASVFSGLKYRDRGYQIFAWFYSKDPQQHTAMEAVTFLLRVCHRILVRIQQLTGSSVKVIPTIDEAADCDPLYGDEVHTSPACMPRRATDYTKVDSMSCLPSDTAAQGTNNSTVSRHGTAEASPATAEPTTQAELDIILRRMLAEPTDEYGMNRLTPSLKYWGYLAESLPMIKNGSYTIEKVHYNTKYIFESEITTVYDVINHPDIVVRYHMHVDSRLSPIDTTVVDYWFLMRLQHTGLVAQAHYFSAPLNPNKYDADGSLCEPAPPGKTRKAQATTPKRHDKPGIRFTILEKVGLSVTAYCAQKPNKAVPFIDAIKMGGQMIRLLEKLHSFSYIHGDVHMGNFAIHHNKLILIDFGHGRIIHNSEVSNHCEPHYQMYWYHRFLSPWEMQKFQSSYRDDVYRALQGVANIVHGESYSKYLEYLYSNPDELDHGKCVQLKRCFANIKLTGSIFEIHNTDDCDASTSGIMYPENIVCTFTLADKVPQSVLDEIRYILSALMSSLLTVRISAKPDYQQMKRGLADIVWLLTHSDTVCDDDVPCGYSDAELEQAFRVNFT